MDLSVIVPCYNVERFIPRLLESLKRQVYTCSVEFLFVDNNSTDNTVGVIESYGIGKVLHCTEQGCGPARNKGLDSATGKWIWFIDSDDWLIGEDAIQTVFDGAESNNTKVSRILYRSTFPEYYSMVWQYVFARSLIGDTRFQPVQPREDNFFTAEMLYKVHTNVDHYKNIPLVSNRKLYNYWYLREGSNMHNFFSKGSCV